MLTNPHLIDAELFLKASAPRLGRNTRTRARLSSSAGLPAGRRVVLLQAPGGFGKTSLLSQWRREWLAGGARVMWLTLDGGDDALRFLNGLYVSIAVADEKPHTPWPQRGLSDDVIRGLTAWLAEVSATDEEWVLMLDDAHRLPAETAQGALAYVLANAPHNLTLAIAARTALNLPLATSRAYGHAVQIGPSDLRFLGHESLELLRARFDSRIDSDACAKIHALTEGWPLGLQLLVATIERKPDLGLAVEQLIASDGGIIEKELLRGLLEQLGTEAHQFLLTISIVDRVDANLARALTGNADAEKLLEHLLATTPVFAESDEGSWLRIHPLIRSHLHRELLQLAPDRRQEMHMCAANLLDERGMHHDAALHALEAGAPQWAYDLAERCLYELAYAGHIAVVLDWVGRIPRDEVQRRPRLLLAAAWSLAVGARAPEATTLLQPLYDAAETPAEVRAEAACILASAHHHADAHVPAFMTIKPWLKAGNIGNVRIDAVMGLHRAGAHLYRGRLSMARYELARIRYIGDEARLDSITGWMEYFSGFSYVWEGRVVAAEAPLQMALMRADTDIGRRSQIAGMLASALSMTKWELNRDIEAAQLLVNRLDLIEHLSNADSIIMGYVVSSRVADLQGASERARDLLEYLFTLGQVRGLRRVCVSALRELIVREVRIGHAANCQRLLDRMRAMGPLRTDIADIWIRLPWAIAHAHAAIAQSQYEAAMQHLDEAADLARHLSRGRDLAEVLLLQVLARHCLGDEVETPLRAALGMARELGLRRIVLDTHPMLSELVRDTIGEMGGWSEAGQQPRVNDSLSLRGGLLTGKERDVLELLSRNLTNKQIAKAMNVGEETVKWHLKNLFSKLDAGTRKHAVERARLLGILS